LNLTILTPIVAITPGLNGIYDNPKIVFGNVPYKPKDEYLESGSVTEPARYRYFV
jgi:hypothetical protein